MVKKILLISSIFLSGCVTVLCAVFIGKTVYDSCRNVSVKLSYQENDPVVILINDIYFDRNIKVHGELEQLWQGNYPEAVKNYFESFSEYYNSSVLKQRRNSSDLSTKYFIRSSSVFDGYFKGRSVMEVMLLKSEIPYYFIRRVDSLDKKQANRVSVYREYLDAFVEGQSVLNRDGANVFCLYAYAQYCSVKNSVKGLELKSEIESFVSRFSNELGENGTLVLQKEYLKEITESLRAEGAVKSWFGKNKIKPYPVNNL